MLSPEFSYLAISYVNYSPKKVYVHLSLGLLSIALLSVDFLWKSTPFSIKGKKAFHIEKNSLKSKV